MFSKETLDKVKLAKQYIQNRYQTILTQQKKNQQNWNKILSLLEPSRDNLSQISQQIIQKQMINKRIQRQKDSLDNYKLFNVIGKGAFGEVRLGKNIANNEVVAIKRLEKRHLLKKKQIYNAYLERDFMMKSTFQDEAYLYLVMEYVQGGDLLHLLIERDILTQDQTRFYIAELILALEQIHKMNFIHRDVKPDNILIDKNGHIKISDFGLSKYLENDQVERKRGGGGGLSKMEKLRKLSQIKNRQKSFSKVGTPDYISPEVLTEKVYTHAVDLWSVGVIMFQCLYGYPPFTDEDSKKVCHKVANWIDYLEFPSEIEVSSCAKMLMLGLMNHSSKRLTIKQIKSHEFFRTISWQSLHKRKAPIIPPIKNDLDTSNFDQFQITNPWTEVQRSLTLNFTTRAENQKQAAGNTTVVQGDDDDEEEEDLLEDEKDKEKDREKDGVEEGRKTVDVGFRFAGFEYRRIDTDPMDVVVEGLMRKSSSQPKSMKKIMNNFKKVMINKHLRTELDSSKYLKDQSNIHLKKRLAKAKKHMQKTSPSQLLNLTNNISLYPGRLSTPKEARIIHEDHPNKQNTQKKPSKTPKPPKKLLPEAHASPNPHPHPHPYPTSTSTYSYTQKLKQIYSSLSSQKQKQPNYKISQCKTQY